MLRKPSRYPRPACCASAASGAATQARSRASASAVRLVHHPPREHVLGAAHALADVEQPLQVDDALAHALELVDRHVPAGDRADHPRVRLADEDAEAPLRGEATEDERVAERREVL